MLNELVENKSRIGFLSLFRNENELAKLFSDIRLITSFNDIDPEEITAKRTAVLENPNQFELHIKNRPFIDLEEILDLCNSMKHDNDIEFIVIDGYERIGNERGSADSRKDIIRSLKRHFEALGIPAMLTFNLPPKKVKKKDPFLEDVWAFDQEFNFADQKMTLFRPEYYGIDKDIEGNSLKNCLIVSKEKSPLTNETMFNFTNEPSS